MSIFTKKNISILVIFLILLVLIWYGNKPKNEEISTEKFKIVTSFYPIYIMTANITSGAEGVEVVNMTDADVGCIHDYTLTTNDMKKLEDADVFIENGLGLEDFTNRVLETYLDLYILNTSTNVMNVITHDNITNPHIWTSIENHIKQVQEIAKILSEQNPENKEIYSNNMDKYVQELTDLKLRYDTELQSLNMKGAVCLNESFEYLAKDIKLDLITIETDHEETALSAELLKSIIEEMKIKNIKIIIIDINDNTKNAETIASETGAIIYKLDSGLTGNLSKESYINSMTGNLEILKNI